MVAAELGVAVQAAKGTAAPAATHRVALMGGALPAPSKVSAPAGSLTVARVAREPIVEVVRVEGSPVIAARPNIAGLLLFAALGSEAVSGAADPYTHTITLGTSQPWLTLWRSIGSLLHERFPDCRLASLEISSVAGRPVAITAAVLGTRAESRTAGQAAGAIESSTVFLHADAQGALVVEGSPVAEIREWRLRIDTGAHFADSLAGPSVRQGPKVSVLLETRQVANDVALWNRHHYGSATPAQNAPATTVPLESGVIQFTLTEPVTPERSLRITVHRPVIEALSGYDADVGGRPLERLVVYRGYGPTTPLTAVVKNGIATTYAAQTAPAPVVHSGAAFLTGRATLAATSTATEGAAAALIGLAALTATATGPETKAGATALNGSATLAAEGDVVTVAGLAPDLFTGTLGSADSAPSLILPGVI